MMEDLGLLRLVEVERSSPQDDDSGFPQANEYGLPPEAAGALRALDPSGQTADMAL